MECKNHTFGMQKPYFWNAKTILLECKNHTFGMQKPYFWNAKAILLECKNHTFGTQKPYFWNQKNGSIRYRIELYDKTNVVFQHIFKCC